MTGFDSLIDGASGFAEVCAVREAAFGAEGLDVIEGSFDALFKIPELDFAHPRGVDDEGMVGEADQFAMAGGVKTTIIRFADSIDLLSVFAKKLIEESRFTDSGRADEGDCLTGDQVRGDGGKELFALVEGGDREAGDGCEIANAGDHALRIRAEIGFGQEDDGTSAALPGDGEVPFDPAWIEVVIE